MTSVIRRKQVKLVENPSKTAKGINDEHITTLRCLGFGYKRGEHGIDCEITAQI